MPPVMLRPWSPPLDATAVAPSCAHRSVLGRWEEHQEIRAVADDVAADAGVVLGDEGADTGCRADDDAPTRALADVVVGVSIRSCG